MNVLLLITLRISTNYTTIYRGHGVKNAAIAHCRPGVTNEIERTTSNEQNRTNEIERTKSNERDRTNEIERTKSNERNRTNEIEHTNERRRSRVNSNLIYKICHIGIVTFQPWLALGLPRTTNQSSCLHGRRYTL